MQQQSQEHWWDSFLYFGESQDYDHGFGGAGTSSGFGGYGHLGDPGQSGSRPPGTSRSPDQRYGDDDDDDDYDE